MCLRSRGVAAESLESRDLDALRSRVVMVVMKVEIVVVVVMVVCGGGGDGGDWLAMVVAYHEVCTSRSTEYCTCHEICTSRPTKHRACHEVCI